MSIDLQGLIENNTFKPPEFLDETREWKHLVEEKEESGEMRLTVFMSDDFPLIALPRQNIFFLKNKKRSDAVILERIESNRYRLHIFEMKRTIKPSIWEDIKEQFNGTYLCCRLIAGLLNLEIDNSIFLYSVFHKDRFANPPIENTDPILERVPTDVNTARELIEWNLNQCNIFANGYPSYFGELEFQHRKIQLEITGSYKNPSGEYRLC